MTMLARVLTALFLATLMSAAWLPAQAPLEALPRAANVKQTLIMQAIDRFQPLREFSQLYPNAFYVLKKEGGRNLVEGRTLLTPYYEIIMRVPVTEPVYNDPLIQTGAAEVELHKLLEIRTGLNPDTLEVIRQYPPVLLDTRDWMQLFLNKGDFGKIGIRLESSFMLPRIDEYRNELRKKADIGW